LAFGCPSWHQLFITLIRSFYLHYLEVADQDPASGSLYADLSIIYLVGLVIEIYLNINKFQKYEFLQIK